MPKDDDFQYTVPEAIGRTDGEQESHRTSSIAASIMLGVSGSQCVGNTTSTSKETMYLIAVSQILAGVNAVIQS